ncbi:MAG: GNAT family N-acetyltransferase [Pseudomonadota bacterium]
MTSGNRPQIRAYDPSDWPRLCVIHDAARKDELAYKVGVAAFRSLEDTFEDEGLFDADRVVAERDGIVAGFAAFDDTELTWLYVDPALSRRGVGRALLRHAMSRSNGTMQIDLLEGNIPAQALYEAEGFVVIDRRQGNLIGNESFPATGLVLRHDV